jgi:hypothetical protein
MLSMLRVRRAAALLAVAVLFAWPGETRGQNSGATIPSQQLQFCSILEEAKSKYEMLDKQERVAREQKSGIVQKRLTDEMTAVHRARNQAIFRALGSTDFKFEDWLLIVREIGVPSTSDIPLKLQPACAPSTTIHATTAASPANLDMLAKNKQGDRLLVSGAFVRRETSRPTPAEQFERSYTESGSIRAPEYTATMTRIKPQ